MPVETIIPPPSDALNTHGIFSGSLKALPKLIVVLGIDVGTSGIRGCIVEKKPLSDASIIASKQKTILLNSFSESLLYSASVALESPLINNRLKSATQDPQLWIYGVEQLLSKISAEFDLSRITDIILDATSSTVFLCNPHGTPLTEALMYNDQQAIDEADLITQTPGFKSQSGATGASSSLAKVLFLLKIYARKSVSDQQVTTMNDIENCEPIYICHQIDYLNHFLSGKLNSTDENNALKLGYDSINQAWPDWVQKILKLQNNHIKLPNVVKPGTPLGTLDSEIASRYGFDTSTVLHAGTTDSIAGFLASGASQVGDVVISLGSTLALKVISAVPAFATDFGIYSHRLKNNWLIGGASNSGGAVLTAQYSVPEITALIHAIQASKLSLSKTEQTVYYPLTKVGERFPIADSNLKPKMPIKPSMKFNIRAPSIEHQHYFLGLLHGLIQIELLAYEKLQSLGCRPLKRIYTVGGGVQNGLWMALREARLESLNSTLKLAHAQSLEAAYGVTRLIEF